MGTQPELERLVELFAAGELAPAIDRTFPLEETDAAFERMRNRDSVGEILITP